VSRQGDTIVAAVLSGATALASSWLLRHVALPSAVRLLVAAFPAPVFLWFIVTELQWIRTFDEFQRRVVLEALAISFPVAILLAVTIDALQKGGFVAGWSVGDVWPFMALLFVPALLYTQRRYDRGE
jgi:hypothetical protein